MKRLALLIMFIGLMAYRVQAQTTAPVLYFSDLTWGPKTGWASSATQGAAVTIYGQNLGSSGTVNACSQTLSSSNSSQVAEWNATTNPTVPRGIGRITFWLNSSMSATCSEGISVTSGGITSNVLPFSIASGTIYFVSPSGSDSNNGLCPTSSTPGCTGGPLLHVYKFDPQNGLGDNQFLMYVRAGTYTTVDPWNGNASALIELYGPIGSSTKQKALISYPGELATLDPRNCTNGAVYPNTDGSAPGGGLQINYITWSKLLFDGTNSNAHAEDALDFFGQYNRFIGNQVSNFRPNSQLQSGFIFVGASQYNWIEGNYFYNNGYDSYAHNIYIKSQTGYTGVPVTSEITHDIDVGWNEINAPYSNDNHGGAIFLSRESLMPTGDNTNHIFIHHNYFHGGTEGDFIYIGDGTAIDYVYIYNNIFNGGTSTAGTTGVPYFNTGSYHIFVYNNTNYQAAGGDATNACMYVSAPTSNTAVVTENNICYGNPNYVMYLKESGGGTWASTNDFFYNPSGTATFSGVTPTSPISNHDPLFVTNGSNFNLQSSSPARGVGVNLYSTLAGLGTTAQGLNLDYNGTSYSNSGAWDDGAAQYGAGAPSQANAPTFSAPSCPYSGLAPIVTIANSNTGTTVACYTTNGSTPATNGAGTSCTTGTQYITDFPQLTTATVKAVAGTSTLADSSVTSCSITVTGQKMTGATGSVTVKGNVIFQ